MEGQGWELRQESATAGEPGGDVATPTRLGDTW